MQIDGFEQDRKVVVIAATNRKQDLDPALIRYADLYSFLLLLFIDIDYDLHFFSWLFV